MKRIISAIVLLPFLVLAGCTKTEVEAPVEVSDEITVTVPSLDIVDAAPLSANVAVCPYSPDYTVVENEEGFVIQGSSIPTTQNGDQGPMCALSSTSSYTFDVPYAVVEIDLSDFDSYEGVLVRAFAGKSGENRDRSFFFMSSLGILDNPFKSLFSGSELHRT